MQSDLLIECQVWDWGGNGFVRYQALDTGQDQIGYVVENSVMHTAFLRQLSRPGKLPVYQPPVSLHLKLFCATKCTLPGSACKIRAPARVFFIK